jgi:hypothetical protein
LIEIQSSSTRKTSKVKRTTVEHIQRAPSNEVSPPILTFQVVSEDSAWQGKPWRALCEVVGSAAAASRNLLDGIYASAAREVLEATEALQDRLAERKAGHRIAIRAERRDAIPKTHRVKANTPLDNRFATVAESDE